jgi:hypothetical protein
MTTQEQLLSQADLKDYQNLKTQTTKLPTAEELAHADAIINSAWKIAQESPSSSPEEIWSEFDAVRTRIAANDSKSS